MRLWRNLAGILLLVIVGHAFAVENEQRNYVMIVGSSTAFPIVSTVAERFGRNSESRSPVVEAMGTGGGIKFFCKGTGLATPDIAMASRKLSGAEFRRCQGNGVLDIVEIKIGYDGIAFANAKGAEVFDFNINDLYLALAREVPDPSGKRGLVKNPYTRWGEINESLPDYPIRLLGPPLTSGTRDILVEQLMDAACQKYPVLIEMKKQDASAYADRCYSFREDGLYIDAGENDARVVRKLAVDKEAVGILGYNFLDRNENILQSATIDGISPEFEMIELGSYPLSRPLFVYVKRKHTTLISDLIGFLREFTSERSWGDEGYLVEKGLIPLTLGEREYWQKKSALGPASCIGGKCREE